MLFATGTSVLVTYFLYFAVNCLYGKCWKHALRHKFRALFNNLTCIHSIVCLEEGG